MVYWEDDTKPETMGKVRVPWNQTAVTVSGLVGNTQFFLTVSAFNTAGTGPFLPSINVTTKKARESHPRLSVQADRSHTVTSEPFPDVTQHLLSRP